MEENVVDDDDHEIECDEDFLWRKKSLENSKTLS